MSDSMALTEPMSDERLEELERIVKHSAQPEATHQHWFPNIYADALCREIRRLREENERLKKEMDEGPTCTDCGVGIYVPAFCQIHDETR